MNSTRYNFNHYSLTAEEEDQMELDTLLHKATACKIFYNMSVAAFVCLIAPFLIALIFTSSKALTILIGGLLALSFIFALWTSHLKERYATEVMKQKFICGLITI